MVLNPPPTNDRLPEANRGEGLEQDWAGNDQDWWDWYVTLAANDDQDRRAGGRARVFPTWHRRATSSCGPSST